MRGAHNHFMTLLLSIISGFAIFEMLALRFGVDTRPGFDEQPERGPRRDL